MYARARSGLLRAWMHAIEAWADWRIRRAANRRGKYLIAFGAVHLSLGIASLVGSPPIAPEAIALAGILDPNVYGVASTVGGVVALGAGMTQRATTAAFVVLAALTVTRSAAHLWVGATFPDAAYLAVGVLFLAVLRMHLLVAGWPEPNGPNQASVAGEVRRLIREDLDDDRCPACGR